MPDLIDWLRENFPESKITPQDNGRYVLMNSPMRYDRNPSLMVWTDKGNWRDLGGNHEEGFLDELCERTGKDVPKIDGALTKKRTDEEKAEEDARKTKRAAQEWNYATPASLEHKYLKAKGITDTFGLRVNRKGQLVIPGVDLRTDTFRMIQTVDDHLNAEGKWHKNDTGPAMFSGWYVGGERGEEHSPLVLAEGPATAATIKTMFPKMAVVCTFGAYNIEADYGILRKRFPSREIVIASDSGTEELVSKLRGALPVIPSAAKSNVDWNDVAVELGQEEAARQFQQKLEVARAARPDVVEEKKSRYELVRIGDIELVEPEYLVAGLIEDKTLGMFFGASGSMKSFLALDLAACVATGLPFHGRQVKEGPVIYLAGEGFNGIKRRLTAWELNTGVSLKDVPLYISRRAPTLANRESAKDVAEAIRDIAETAGHPALICIDTVARATVGADENSNSDMGEFIETVDEIRHEHDCALLTVHHSGLADKDRGRGASAIHAALDVEYQVTKDGTSVTLLNKKMKDGAEPEPIHFQATEITVGQARNGDPITSLALEETDEAPREREKPLTPAQKLGLDTFMIAAEKAGTLGKDGAFVGLHVDDWRPFFYERHTADNVHAKSVAFARARERLVARGDISVENDYYRLSGAMAILEKSIVEKLKESGSHKSQESHMCITCDSSQRKDESHTVTPPFRGVTCDSPVTSENDVVPSGEVEKEPVILFPRGSLEEHASRSGVPVDQIRESLKPLLESGRIVLSGNDIYENPTRPNVEDPSEAIEDDGQEEDAPTPGPEKIAEAPADSLPRGEGPVPPPRNGEVVFPDPLPLPFMWPGKGWIVEVEILGDGSRSFGLSQTKTGKARGWLREPKGGKL